MIAKIAPTKFALNLLLVALMTAVSFGETADKFLCEGKWDGKSERRWVFEGEGKNLIVNLNPNRCSFSLGEKSLGWSEFMPSLQSQPIFVSVIRDKFRWLLLVERRLAAFAFADLPAKVKPVGISDVDIHNLQRVSELNLAPLGWERCELEDGSVAFRPKSNLVKGAVKLMVNLPPLIDFSVSLEVQPNGARSVGIGFCWGDDGGYLWRWWRSGKESFWQLVTVSLSNSGWELKTLWEETANVPFTSWHKLQVWHSLDQIWVGVDGELMAQVRDNRFGQGQIVLWVETGDLPMPLVKPARITHWWCSSLSPDIDTFLPFPSLFGRWSSGLEFWSLEPEKKGLPAVALLGEANLPFWWVADVKWNEQSMGLVFGWLNEEHYNLLRLRPEKIFPDNSFSQAVLEIAIVRGRREQVLDKFGLVLIKGGLYRMAVQLTENSVVGFINGMGLLNAKVTPLGKVGLWSEHSLALKRFWLYSGEEPLFSLIPEDGSAAQPITEQLFSDHELVSFTLPSGLPPNVPLSAKLSKEPVTLYVLRIGDRLVFRLEKQNSLLGTVKSRVPKRPPLVIKLERRDRLILVWVETQLIWTVKLQ